MLRNLYNTSRDVTPHLPPPPLALLRPPHQLLNARGSLWVSQSVSQSVRASDDGSWASPCPHARSEGAHKAQDRLWDLLLGARQHLDYKTRFFLFIFFISVAVFFFSLPTSGLEKQPAIMSRAPEDVSKLTESTYKVSEITQQIRR